MIWKSRFKRQTYHDYADLKVENIAKQNKNYFKIVLIVLKYTPSVKANSVKSFAGATMKYCSPPAEYSVSSTTHLTGQWEVLVCVCLLKAHESIWEPVKVPSVEPKSRFSNTLGPKRAGGLWGTNLAVDGTVQLGFASKTDDSPQAATKLLQNEAFCHGLRLVGEFGLLGLLQQTVTRRLGHFLCYECVWQPGKRFILELLQDHSPTLMVRSHQTNVKELELRKADCGVALHRLRKGKTKLR